MSVERSSGSSPLLTVSGAQPAALASSKRGATLAINGPSICGVPQWVDKRRRLGGYYMYSSCPSGKYLRLAVADAPAGPYSVSNKPLFTIDDVAICGGHMSNPWVVVDDVTKRIMLYYHCGVCVAGTRYTCGMGGEVTFVAVSSDGVTFNTEPRVLWRNQLRSVRIGDWFYMFGRREVLVSPDGERDVQFHGMVWIPAYAAPLMVDKWLYLFWSEEGEAESTP